MGPEQVTDFKREIAALDDTSELEDLVARVKELFKKYDLPLAPEISDRQRRRCQTTPVPIFTSLESSALRASRYKTYTGRTAYLLSGGSLNIGWCATLNVLVLRSMSWSAGDNYLRIPESSSTYIRVLSAYEFASYMLNYSRRLNIIWMEGELDGSQTNT